MSLAAAGDAVAHSGQAVTLAAARGQHLFTRTKRFLMDWAQERGAGRDVQRGDRRPPLQPAGQHRARRPRDRLPARLDPGLGRQRRRRGAAAAAPVGGALLHEAERRPRAPRLRARAPPRDRRPDARALRAARHPRPAAGRRSSCAVRTELHVEVDARPQPGADHRPRARRRPRGGGRAPSATTSSTAVGLDADLRRPAAGDAGDRPGRRPPRAARRLLRRGSSPTASTDGDVLRMQSLHRVRVKADDVAVASDHGRELLDYVLADLPRRSRPRPRPRARPGGRRPCA